MQDRHAVLESMYAAHSAAVHGCARFIAGALRADDVTVRVFVDAWGQIGLDDPDVDVRLQLMSRAHRMAVVARLDDPPVADDASATMTQAERSALALVACGGCSCRQAALILGAAEGDVMRSLNGAMKKLGPVWSASETAGIFPSP